MKTALLKKTKHNLGIRLRRTLSLILALSLLIGSIPGAPFLGADDKWKIMELVSLAGNQTITRMQVSARQLTAEKIETNPWKDFFALNVSMQYTQRYDLKLYALKDSAEIETGASWYSGYFDQVDNITENYPALHDPTDKLTDTALDCMWNETNYNNDPNYEPGNDGADPRGEFLGYLYVNGEAAKDIVLPGFDGELSVDPYSTIVSGTELPSDKYVPAAGAEGSKERRDQYDRQLKEQNFIIMEESTSGPLSRIFWDGTIITASGENTIPPALFVDEKNQNGNYLIAAEPKGVDIFRTITEPELVGYDEYGPLYENKTRVYPDNDVIELNTVPSLPYSGGVYTMNWARHYVSMLPVRFDYNASPSVIGWDPKDWEELLGEKKEKADPVNVLTGNFIWEYTDLSVNGRAPFAFSRTYNAQEDYGGDENKADAAPMGYGWRHSFEYTLERQEYSATVQLANGYQINLASSLLTPGEYHSWNDPKYILEQDGASYRLSTPYEDNYLFNSAGRLTAIEKLGIPQITLTYSGDKLDKISAVNSGAYFTLNYGGNRITSVTDNAGRTVDYHYDASGNLISAENPDGDALNFAYEDPEDIHNMTAIYDFAGGVYLKNTYDEHDRVIKQDMPGRGSAEFIYDPEGQVNTFTDYNGAVSTYVYNQNYQLLKKTDGNGSVTQTYDDEGRMIKKTDPIGNVTEYEYDDLDRLVKITYPDGETEQITYNTEGQIAKQTFRDGTAIEYAYDNRGNLIELTDQKGNSFSFTYDGSDNLTKASDRLGNITSYTYDSLGNPLTISDPENNITSYAYDAVGRLIKTTTPEGVESSYTYSDAGKLLSITDNDANTTEYTSDKNGYTTSVTNALGQSAFSEYNNLGQLLNQTDPLGSTLSYTYNENGSLASQTDELGYISKYTYDPFGSQISVTDRKASVTRYEYDALNRRTATKNPDGGVIKNQYDQMSRLIKQTDPLGNTTAYAYDPMGRIKSVTDALTGVLRYTYDKNGNITQSQDKENHTTKYEYDAEDRLIKIINPLNETTVYVYDDSGRLTETINSAGHITKTSYDRDGRILSETNPLPQSTTYQYDAGGHLISKTLPDSVTEITYTYDRLDRLITESNPGGGETKYEYDALDRLVKITEPLGAESVYTYTKRGELESVTDDLGNTTGYTYDPEGNLASILYPDGAQLHYEYDSMNRLKTESDGQNNVTSYTYDSNSNLTQIKNPDGGIICTTNILD
jgi:YD repeat-containing protein